MASQRMTVVLTVMFATSAAVIVAAPVTHQPSPQSLCESDLTLPSDVVADGSVVLPPDLPVLPSERLDGDPDRIALGGEPGQFVFSLTFVEDPDHAGRLELERLNAQLRLDRWDHASVRPSDLTGWLTGRENAWGRTDQSGSEKIADMFNDIGCTLPVGITAGLLASDSPSRRRAGRTARDAVLATSAATHLLKAVVNSSRPVNPDNYEGFPSGHTSLTVAFARAIAEDHREWGALAYLWAGGVAWSRVHRGDHTTEQVIAGALLGWFLADAMASGPGRSEFTVPRDAGPVVPAGGVRW
ncbi:MAG: phosphatase PAP2 family protein [Armatimonadota bacterium]|jgi:hypothetical protein